MKKSIMFFLSALVLTVSISALMGCGKSNIKPMKDIEVMEQEMGGIEKKKLRKAWGDPDYSMQDKHTDIWEEDLTGAPSFVIATYDENDKTVIVSRSAPLYVVITNIEDGVLGTIGWNEYKFDSGSLCFIPETDYFGNKIEYEVGDYYYFEFAGLIMESYPAQIDAPYYAAKMGTASEEEMALISKCMEDYRNGFIFDNGSSIESSEDTEAFEQEMAVEEVTPTGYPEGEIQREYLFYEGHRYVYFDEYITELYTYNEMPTDDTMHKEYCYDYIGEVKSVDNENLPDEELEGSRLEVGMQIYCPVVFNESYERDLGYLYVKTANSRYELFRLDSVTDSD